MAHPRDVFKRTVLIEPDAPKPSEAARERIEAEGLSMGLHPTSVVNKVEADGSKWIAVTYDVWGTK